MKTGTCLATGTQSEDNYIVFGVVWCGFGLVLIFKVLKTLSKYISEHANNFLGSLTKMGGGQSKAEGPSLRDITISRFSGYSSASFFFFSANLKICTTEQYIH